MEEQQKMTEKLKIKITEGYVIISKNGTHNAFDEKELEAMVKEHFQLKNNLQTLTTKFRELHEFVHAK